MSNPGEWLKRYHVEPDDFDSAFDLLNDPQAGIVLMENDADSPSMPEILAGIEEAVTSNPLVATGTVSGFEDDIHIHVRPDYSLAETTEQSPPTRIELEDEELKKNILSTLAQSLKIRTELATRLARRVSPGIAECLQACGFIGTEGPVGITGEGVASPPSRIDCHKANASPNGFSTKPHGDSSLFTEHCGESNPGLRVLDPQKQRLRPAPVPEGHRLLTRGRHWQYSTTSDSVAVLHDVQLLDTKQARARWVALWRAHSIVDHMGVHNAKYAEDCLEAEVEAYIDHLGPKWY